VILKSHLNSVAIDGDMNIFNLLGIVSMMDEKAGIKKVG